MSPPTPPETYTLPTIPHVPNSPLPVLLYRAVLPSPADPATARAALEANAWLQGGVFKAFTRHHFHSVTHECYAVVRGGSRLVLGVGPLDGSAREEGEKETKGVEVDVEAGDIIVMPAGVSHCSLSSHGDYEYLGVYPKGSPHWDNNFCDAGPEETAEKAEAARSVPVPETDPIYGKGGPLVDIWTKAAMGILQ